MTPVQRSLEDPAYYRTPVDREALLERIDAGEGGYGDHETRSFMRRAVEDINRGGPLTIEVVEDALVRSKAARDAPHDRSLHEFAILSVLGDEALLGYLVHQANQLAKGIQPGAKAMLGDAF